jgi:hypothetical protein
MPVFRRRTPPPQIKKPYTAYRPLVREDFVECCAYCLLHELAAGGPEAFELDHFKPASRPDLTPVIDDFYNLYYSCGVCNAYKSNTWPTPEQEELGLFFVDLCTDDFSRHFAEDDDGIWHPLTKAGEYTAAKLRLNRQHLVGIRRLLRSLASRRGGDPIDWNRPCKPQIFLLLE